MTGCIDQPRRVDHSDDAGRPASSSSASSSSSQAVTSSTTATLADTSAHPSSNAASLVERSSSSDPPASARSANPSSSSRSNTVSSRAAATPVTAQLSIVYKSPRHEDSNPSQLLTPQEVAAKFGVAVYARNDGLGALPAQRAAGYRGTALQYLIVEPTFYAPPTITAQPLTAASAYCSPSQTAFGAYSNNITLTPGAYCQIHDSIVGGLNQDPSRKFDHDLDPSTPPLWAQETWFLHRADTHERYASSVDNARAFYGNPAVVEVQEYYSSRVLEQLAGSARYPVFGMDGVYLDNVDLGWDRLAAGLGSHPEELPSNDAYANAVWSLVSAVHGKLHSQGHTFLVYGNMTLGDGSTAPWDRFAPVLEGGLKEDFAFNWGRGRYPNATLLNQWAQAQSWQALGRHWMAVAPSNLWGDCPNNTACQGIHPHFDQDARFALAAYLLVTDGAHASFKISNLYGDPAGSRAEQYDQYFDYPETAFHLGAPLQPFELYSGSPLVYRRVFECGQVDVDLTAGTGSIHQVPGC